MPYKQLTREERHTIELELKEGKSASAIATKLNRSRSTISREIRRNSLNYRNYCYANAEKLRQVRP